MLFNHDVQVLIIDDDQDILDAYQHLLSIAGLTSKGVINPIDAITEIHSEWQGVVLIDMYMPQMDGMTVLEHIQGVDPGIPTIIITGHGDIPMAVKAVQNGADEFLEKPINPQQLLSLIHQHLAERKQKIEQNITITTHIKKKLIGNSAQMNELRQHIKQYSLLDSHLILTGESGIGRHHCAELIHQLSARSSQTLLEVDGHHIQTLNALEAHYQQAENTTLIMTHLHLMPENLQYWLTQQLLLQERLSYKKVRVIALFNQDPEHDVTSGTLQPELFYMLSQGRLDIPSLRQRPDDISALFHYFLKLSCKKLAKVLPEVDAHYLHTLRNHEWKGNIRELRNIAELYAIGIVKLTGPNRAYDSQKIQLPLDELVDDYEKQLIEDSLYLFSGKVTEASLHLQVPRKKLYLRMKKHELDKNNYKSR